MIIHICIQFLITAVYACIMLYLLYHWSSIPVYKPGLDMESHTSVTIVIPVRNEEHIISNLLSDILNQSYPKQYFEVIVVDDHSTDSTYQEVVEFQKRNPGFNLKVIKNQTDLAQNMYKKSAITLAVNQAVGDLIITTDADCRVGAFWVQTFVEFYEMTKAKFISGPVVFSKENSWFEKLQHIEFTGLIGVGAASIHAGIPMMCNGANLAYERKAFINVGGYANNNKASGDDVFLMFKLSKKFSKEIHFLKSREAIVSTTPQKNIYGFFHQRKRWASKVTNYTSFYTLFVAAFVYLLNLSLLLGIGITVYDLHYGKVLLLQLGIKCVVDFLFVYKVEDFFNRRKLLYLFFIGQILNIFYVSIVASVAPFGKYIWKGRKLK